MLNDGVLRVPSVRWGGKSPTRAELGEDSFYVHVESPDPVVLYSGHPLDGGRKVSLNAAYHALNVVYPLSRVLEDISRLTIVCHAQEALILQEMVASLVLHKYTT